MASLGAGTRTITLDRYGADAGTAFPLRYTLAQPIVNEYEDPNLPQRRPLRVRVKDVAATADLASASGIDVGVVIPELGVNSSYVFRGQDYNFAFWGPLRRLHAGAGSNGRYVYTPRGDASGEPPALDCHLGTSQVQTLHVYPYHRIAGDTDPIPGFPDVGTETWTLAFTLCFE